MSTNSDVVSRIPQDIATLIFAYLPVEDLARTTRVCKRWQTLANEEILWKSFAQSLNLDSPNDNKPDWKDLVVSHICRKSNTISSKQILYARIEHFFKRHLKIVLDTTAKSSKKKPVIIQLEYRSTSNPDARLYVSLAQGKWTAMDFIQNTSSCELKLIGKGKADMGKGPVSMPICHTIPEKSGFLGMGARPAVTRCLAACQISDEFLNKIDEILTKLGFAKT